MNPPVRDLPTVHLPFERFDLACGARLVVSPRPGAPVAAIEVHVRGGPSLDPKGLEGVAYLTGGLLDQGTRSRSEAEIAGLLEPAGGEISGDASGLHSTIVNADWKLLVEMLADVLTAPRFPVDEVRRQQERLLHRLEVERDDPRAQAGRRFRKLVYGNHWLGRAPYGSLKSVALIEPAHLRAHHRENWVASRALIAMCGDVDPTAVRRELDRRLKQWKRGKPLAPRRIALPERGRRVTAYKAARQQVHLFLGHLGITRSDPDYAALTVMDHVLGTGPGFTNRISRILRDELGLAYSVQAAIHSSAGILPGMFTAYIGTSPKHVGTAVQSFLDEIRRMQDEPVPEAELEVAKSYLVGSFPMGYERASRRAAHLVTASLHEFPDDHLDRLVKSFADVTREDVQRVARKHLFADRCCIAASGPVEEAELGRLLERASKPKRRKSTAPHKLQLLTDTADTDPEAEDMSEPDLEGAPEGGV